MSPGPLVSIIIPCYNQGNYIKECIESAINQTYSNIEIIIVNDGSSDIETNIILSKINHPLIRIINKKNQGLAEARNSGIINSGGEYVLPLDADDKIGATYIEKAVCVFQKNSEVKVVTCLTSLFGVKSGLMELPEFSIETLLARNTMVCCSLFKRIDYNATDGYNSNMKYGFEDWDFWLSLLEKGGNVIKIPEVLFYYRIKRKSMIANMAENITKLSLMRKQIYENHKELYSTKFFDPFKSFEYELVVNSKEYILGTSLLKFLRYLQKIYLGKL